MFVYQQIHRRANVERVQGAQCSTHSHHSSSTLVYVLLITFTILRLILE